MGLYIDYETGEKVTLEEWNRRKKAREQAKYAFKLPAEKAKQAEYVSPIKANAPTKANLTASRYIDYSKPEEVKSNKKNSVSFSVPKYTDTDGKKYTLSEFNSRKFADFSNPNEIKDISEKYGSAKKNNGKYFDGVDYVTLDEWNKRKNNLGFYESEYKKEMNRKGAFDTAEDSYAWHNRVSRIEAKISALKKNSQAEKDKEYYRRLTAKRFELEKVAKQDDFILRATNGRNNKDNELYRKVRGELGGAGNNSYKFMNQDELDTYCYYFDKYYKGKKYVPEAEEYLETLKPKLNSMMTENESGKSYKFGQEHEVGAGILHAVKSAPAGLGALFEVANTYAQNKLTGKYKPVDKNSGTMLLQNKQDAMLEGVLADNVNNPITYALTSIGISIGDMVFALPFGKTASLLMMSTSSAGSAALNAAKRGASPEQSLVSGVTAGAISYITEKIGLDNLFRLAGKPSAYIFRALISQIGSEAAEEGLEAYAGFLADAQIMGENSEYNRYIRELMSTGFDKKQATRAAKKKFLVQDPISAMVGGAVSGLFFGSVATPIGILTAGKAAIKNGDVTAILARAEKMGGNAEALASEIKAKKAPDAWKVGKLLGVMGESAENKRKDGYLTINTGIEIADDTKEFLQKTAVKTGVNIEVRDIRNKEGELVKSAEGMYDRSTDTVVFSPSVTKRGIIEGVMFHELTHSIEKSQYYGKYANFAMNQMFNGDKNALEAAIKQKIEAYKGHGEKLDPTGAIEELVAAYSRENLTSEDYINRLVSNDEGLARQIYNSIVRTIETTKAYLRGDVESLQLVKAQRLFEKALDNRGVEPGEGQSYEIKTLDNGKKYVQADRQVVFSNDPTKWGSELEEYINKSIRNGKDVEIVTEDGDIIKITKDTAWKIGDMHGWDEESFPVKMNMGVHVDELLAASKRDNNKEAGDRSEKRFKPESFDYQTAFFRDSNGEYYRVNLSVGVFPNGKVGYSIGRDIQKRSFPYINGSSSKGGALSRKKLPNTRLTQTDEKSKPFLKKTEKNSESEKTAMQIALEKAGVDNSIFKNGENDTSQFSFAGEKAKTADNSLLKTAISMSEKGKSAEDIYKETGWGKGQDGKWRFEIGDSKLKMKNIGNSDTPRYVLHPYDRLVNMIEHPSLFESYPMLREIKVIMYKDAEDGKGGEYNPRENIIKINLEQTGKKAEDIKSTLIHEIQHAIQYIEDFAKGASPEYWDKFKNATLPKEKGAFELYYDTAGEIEARDSSSRMDMSSEERRNQFPESMKPNDDVVFAEGRVSYSIVNENGKDIIIINDTGEKPTLAKTEKEMLRLFKNLTGENAISTKNDNQLINLNRRGIKEYLRSDYVVDELPEYMQNVVYLSGKQLDELIKCSIPVYSYPNNSSKHTKDASMGWQHREIIFEAPDYEKNDGTWRRYEARLIVRKNNMGNYSHGIVGLIRKGSAKYGMAHNEAAIKSAEPFTDNRISQPDPVVNTHSMQKSKNDAQFSFRENVSTAGSTSSTVEDAAREWKEKGTQSKYFKKWFGNSKVVNEDGTPKVVYHGTYEKFTTFDITKSRSYEAQDYDLPGFYFSESTDESGSYGEIGKYYIKITTPYEGSLYALAKETGSYRKAYEYLIEQGYDGVIVDEFGEGETEYIALKPENIKSATDNIGTFDRKNKDIRYSFSEDGSDTSGESQETKQRQFYGNTMDRAKAIPDEFMEKLNPNDFDYIPETSEYWQKQALKNVREDIDGVIERIKAAPSISGGVEGHEAAAVSVKLMNDYLKSGDEADFKKANDIFKLLARKGTETGRALKSIDTAWDKVGAAAAAVRAHRTVKKARDAMEKRKPKKIFDAERETNMLKSRMKNAEEAAKKEAAEKKLTPEEAAKLEKEKKKKLIEHWLKDSPVKTRKNKTLLEKVQEMYDAGVYDNDSIAQIVSEKRGIPYLSDKDVAGIIEHVEKANAEEPGSYRQRAELSRAEKILISRIPVSTFDKIRGFAVISLLALPKTHGKNITGNIIHGSYEAVREHTLGLFIDVLTSLATKNRTISGDVLGKGAAYAKGFGKGCLEWYLDIKNKVDTSPTKTFGEVKRNTRIYKSAVLNFLDVVIKKLLSLGDRPFYQAAYESRLYELGKLNEKTENKKTAEEMVIEARLYALDKVFQNDSTAKRLASKLKSSPEVIKNNTARAIAEVGMTVVVPFSETPSNILAKVAENSPLGFVTAVRELGKTRYGAFDQQKFVTSLSRALTGSGLMAAGAMLFLKGMLTARDPDEDKDEYRFKQSMGFQNYALKLGNTYYSTSWANPIATVLLIGAEMARSAKDGDNILESVFGSTKVGIDSFFEGSYVSGISDFFSSGSIAEGLSGVALDSVNFFTAASAFLNGLAKFFDPYARETSDENPLRQMLKERAAALPFVSKMLPIRIDAFGNEIKSTGGGNTVFNVFFNPARISEYVATDVHYEILSVFDETGKNSVFPDYITNKEIKFDGDGVMLDDRQFEKYKRELGTGVYEELEKVFQTEVYESMSPEDKAAEIEAAKQAIKNSVSFKFIKNSRDMLSNLMGSSETYGTTAQLKLDTEYARRWAKLTPDAKTIRDAEVYGRVSKAMNAFEESGLLTGENATAIYNYTKEQCNKEASITDIKLLLVSNATGSTALFNNDYASLLEFTKDKVAYKIKYPKALLSALISKADAAVEKAYAAKMNSAEYKKLSLSQRADMLSKAKKDARAAVEEEFKNRYGYTNK